jgi:hypothetical protein
MVSRRIPIALAVACLTLLRATATIVPVPDLDKLVSTSHLIVLGELLTIEQGANRTVEANGTHAQVRADQGVLRIDDAISGSAGSPVRFETLVPQNAAVWQTPAQQIYGLFFLRTDDNGKTSLTDTYNAYIPVPHGVYGRGTTPMDRAISILAEMLTLPNNRSANSTALEFLEFSKSKATNNALRVGLETATNPELRIRIANALVLQGDATSLKYLKEVFLTGPGNAVSDQQQQILGNVMATSLEDPEAIPDLTALLDSYSVPIRRGAAQALRRTESPKAISGLIKALEDTDSQVRYWGVVGLAEVTGQEEWRPDQETFKAREPDYMSHWKEWARIRR